MQYQRDKKNTTTFSENLQEYTISRLHYARNSKNRSSSSMLAEIVRSSGCQMFEYWLYVLLQQKEKTVSVCVVTEVKVHNKCKQYTTIVFVHTNKFIYECNILLSYYGSGSYKNVLSTLMDINDFAAESTTIIREHFRTRTNDENDDNDDDGDEEDVDYLTIH
ncbi:hypothetical protein FF38_07696 [Lucilia cuprina]|uniref:Uncharacterized protein n=1 Tax=Lucilia cuprina TaxID=7375 RepID=A0A0L0CHR7_LUCCU|nr:hypothetical protein FF38_07696 [Lucilia cuprina]